MLCSVIPCFATKGLTCDQYSVTLLRVFGFLSVCFCVSLVKSSVTYCIDALMSSFSSECHQMLFHLTD